MRYIRSAVPLALILITAGCPAILGSDWVRRVGNIVAGGPGTPPITLPATAQRGVPFTATVTTHGSSSCTRADGAEVSMQSASTVQVTPYDLVNVAGVCTADLHPFPREVTLRFDQAGEATIRVHGANEDYVAHLDILP